jgi:hypothetical protein
MLCMLTYISPKEAKGLFRAIIGYVWFHLLVKIESSIITHSQTHGWRLSGIDVLLYSKLYLTLA